MHVSSLRDAFARLRIIDQWITLNYRDSFKMLRKHTSCQQPGHAPTNHNRMVRIESLLLFHSILIHNRSSS
jgi:hypothetical protein